MSSKIQTKSASDSKAKSYEDKLLKKLANSAIDLSSDPNDFQALKSASTALGGFGMANETIEACDRAIKLNPKDDEIINTKGVAYFQLKMYDQALKCFDMTISMNKKSTAAYNNKGLVYAKLGDLKRALVCFNIAISMDPQFQEAIMNRANVHSDLDEALECFDKCLSTKFDEDTYAYQRALLGKALVLSKMSRYNETLPFFNKLIDMKELDQDILHRAYLFRGEACAFLNLNEQAVESYKKGIEIKPTELRVNERCSDALVSLKRYEESLIYIQREIDVTDKTNTCWNRLKTKKIQIENWHLNNCI